jgi:hypothetical protein
LRFREIAYGLHASVLRVCLAFVTMESVDTIHVISDNEAACVHVGAAGVENVSFSCGGTEVDTNIEVMGSTAHRLIDVNVHLGEAVAEEEQAAWGVLQDKLSTNQKLWLPHHRNSPLWAFYMLKDGLLQCLDTSKSQMLRCILYHPTPTASTSLETAPVSKNTRKHVGMLKYTSEHGLTSMKKHAVCQPHEGGGRCSSGRMAEG